MIRRLPHLLVLVGLLAADLLSKDVVFTRLDGYRERGPYESIDVIPDLFRLVIVKNRGVTFGLGQGLGPIWSIINVVAIVVLLVLLWRTKSRRWVQATCLTLILAGALGNLYDRLRFGWVRDFLDFYVGEKHWPPFNVADAAIVVGVLVLAVVLWRTPDGAKKDST